MRLQRTVKREIVFEGRGLHTDKYAVVRLLPAPRNSGVVFYRSDKGAAINAHVDSVSDTAFATTLGLNGTRIRSVEHILAAIAGLGIDNILIEVNGPEIPALDGSSSVFVRMMLEAGIARQGSGRPYMKVIKPVCFSEADSEITVVPYDGRKITYRIYYDHRLLGHQQMSIDIQEGSFIKELAPARTFGFLKDIARMRARGLAKGGSLDNAVILSETDILNASGLRFKDEFIRHKILDIVGDFSLLGCPLYGHIIASRSGHATNMRFMKKLLSSHESWEMVTESSEEQPATPALIFQ